MLHTGGCTSETERRRCNWNIQKGRERVRDRGGHAIRAFAARFVSDRVIVRGFKHTVRGGKRFLRFERGRVAIRRDDWPWATRDFLLSIVVARDSNFLDCGIACRELNDAGSIYASVKVGVKRLRCCASACSIAERALSSMKRITHVDEVGEWREGKGYEEREDCFREIRARIAVRFTGYPRRFHRSLASRRAERVARNFRRAVNRGSAKKSGGGGKEETFGRSVSNGW